MKIQGALDRSSRRGPRGHEIRNVREINVENEYTLGEKEIDALTNRPRPSIFVRPVPFSSRNAKSSSPGMSPEAGNFFMICFSKVPPILALLSIISVSS